MFPTPLMILRIVNSVKYFVTQSHILGGFRFVAVRCLVRMGSWSDCLLKKVGQSTKGELEHLNSQSFLNNLCLFELVNGVRPGCGTS